MERYIPKALLDARLTLLESGQVFHWAATERGICGVSGGRFARLEERDGGYALRCEEGDRAFWRNYFDLGRDYGALLGACAHPLAARAVSLLPGLRVLNQPPWEALVAFILSANNNVARIRRLVLGLCGALGEPAGDSGMKGFPTPERLAEAGEAALRNLGCGYRAPYLIGAARMVADGFPLDSLRGLPYEEALKLLVQLPGVGEKVADCALLFGCGHASAFPVDVWVERLMRGWFRVEAKNRREIGAAGRAMFGPEAGRLQQYLFHCARLGLIPL